MSKYLITLRPIDKFFFGGDMTFPVKGDAKHNDKYASYIIESAYFPQQTSLLGMMRFLLLRNDSSSFVGNRIVDTGKAAKLIGESSFCVGRTGSFGKINSIGHCFIRDGKTGNDYHFAPYDVDYKAKLTDCNCVVNGRTVKLPELHGFVYKDWYRHYLICGNDKKKLSDFFKEDRRIGIDRNVNTGRTEDSSLYKQISYRFAEESYMFAFYAEVDDSIDLVNYKGQIVSVGADSSQFAIGIEKVTVEDTIDSACYSAGPCKVTLLSPARLLREQLKNVSYCMSEVVPFRFIKTSVEKTGSYNVFNENYKRSERYELYASGSVFYFSDGTYADDFKKALESHKDFRQIGYNEYK